jgi:hypothetical protein
LPSAAAGGQSPLLQLHDGRDGSPGPAAPALVTGAGSISEAFPDPESEVSHGESKGFRKSSLIVYLGDI